ncbi:hypothetical protein AX16_008604 [Volvariella volvacea WC 439]|nr:hypothetical protein AX16_008604 [Volvariella volvacea WC 439]
MSATTTIIKTIPSASSMIATTTAESITLPPHSQPIIATTVPMTMPLNTATIPTTSASIPPTKGHNSTSTPVPASIAHHHAQAPNQNQRANIETSLGPDGIHMMTVTFSPHATECTDDDISPKLPPPNQNWGLKLRILAQNPVTHATWDGDSYHHAMDAVSNVIAKFKYWDSLAEFDIECP